MKLEDAVHAADAPKRWPDDAELGEGLQREEPGMRLFPLRSMVDFVDYMAIMLRKEYVWVEERRG